MAVFCAFSGDAQQVTGVIRGTVYDPSGATVSAAVVTVTQIETGFTRQASSSARGEFTLGRRHRGDFSALHDRLPDPKTGAWRIFLRAARSARRASR